MAFWSDEDEDRMAVHSVRDSADVESYDAFARQPLVCLGKGGLADIGDSCLRRLNLGATVVVNHLPFANIACELDLRMLGSAVSSTAVKLIQMYSKR